MNANLIDLENAVNHQVTVSAVAHNAKAGAVIMTDCNEVIYIRGLKEWQDAMIGKRVLIDGILRRGRIYPDVKVEAGVSSQGITEEQWFLEGYNYRAKD